MRTLHFHTLHDLHRPDWLNFKFQRIHVFDEPLLWVVLIVSLLLLTAVLFAIFHGSPAPDSLPYPTYYP